MDQQEQPKSFIQVIFKDIGSVEFNIMMDGIVPMQLLAIAEYFHFLGESGLVQEKVREAQQAQKNKIVVPGMELPQ